jgi:iron(III) transport system substrate-binding protein
MRRRRAVTHWRAAATLVAACALLAACSSAGTEGTATSSDPADGQAQSITLYSGQHEQTTDGLATAFEKQTGVTVNVRNDDKDTLANLIAVQGSHTPADFFYTENSPALEFLQEKDLLASVDSSTLSHTPSQYNSQWTGSGFPLGSA